MRRTVLQLVEVVTVGLPFCAFKLLTGALFLEHAWLSPVGWGLVGLGAIDLAINVANLMVLALGRERVFGVCLSEILLRRARPQSPAWHDLGIAVDVALSFVLVAVVVGLGFVQVLPIEHLRVWNACVVLNVLGAGFGRLAMSFDAIRGGS